ncbi:MAG: hypothetical protein A3J87_02170 [Sideroxydans sp. RIFOXYB12_FULL_59_6]|nr:MAG: hypothetical protein A3J87_02170 [Sideroxydans sp. RIFOXYB12_FULL_59_6]
MQEKLIRVAACLLLAAVGTAGCSGLAFAENGHEHMNHEHMDHSKIGAEVHDHTQHQAMLEQRGVLSRTARSYTIPDIKMVDRNGRSVAIRGLLDGREPVILNFIFTTCTTICPVMSSTFEQVQEQLGDRRNRVRMVSVSIDPENDTPARLKAYARRYNAGSQWQMLTGSVANSFAVQNAFEVAVGDKMNHKPLAFIRAPGRDAGWVRIDGLVAASDIVNELNRLESIK